jgi:hypothetical protein
LKECRILLAAANEELGTRFSREEVLLLLRGV